MLVVTVGSSGLVGIALLAGILSVDYVLSMLCEAAQVGFLFHSPLFHIPPALFFLYLFPLPRAMLNPSLPSVVVVRANVSRRKIWQPRTSD